MKRISVLGLVLSVCVISATAAPKPHKTWNLWENLQVDSNQISFHQGSNGVWYFLESRTFSHNPLTYFFLPDYEAPCKAFVLLIDGLTCWDSEGNTAPLVEFNFTDTTQFPLPGLGIPPRSLAMHPGMDRLVIVGWKSPVNSNVNIVGSFSDLDPNCGNGVLWFIDSGSTTLTSGDIPNGGAESFSLSSLVKKNQLLYFIVDPKGDYSCDTTSLKLVITAQ